jgi:probable HAF family extracellular repeat protein
LLGGLLCASFAAQAQTAQATQTGQVQYRVGVFLPDVSMYAINNAGSMAGETRFSQEGALLYANGVLTDLTPRGPGAGAAYGINNAGAVVGTAASNGTRQAFVYRNGSLSTLDPSSNRLSEAHDINASGQITGWGLDAAGSFHAFLYDRGTVQSLAGFPGSGQSYGQAINNRGQIVGEVEVLNQPSPPFFSQAFLYENGRMRLLGIPGVNSTARDINDAGQIVGTGEDHDVPFAYLYDHGQITRIPGFGGTRSIGQGINQAGQVVGIGFDASGNNQSGFLYDHGVLTNLSTAVPGWTIAAAVDINDRQQIVAAGCRLDGGGCGALRLDPVTPVPEPGGWAMLGCGALVIGMLARRRRSGKT